MTPKMHGANESKSALRQILWRSKNRLLAGWWLCRHFHRLRVFLLTDFGICNVVPFRFLAWHSGSKYFTGIRLDSDLRLFVKFSSEPDVIRREVSAITHLQAVTSSQAAHFPEVVAHGFDPYPFIAIRFLQAPTLATLLERAPALASEQKVVLLQQFVSLLHHLHEARIIHRDITPANLLVCSDSVAPATAYSLRIVLVDFAFALHLPVHNPHDASVTTDSIKTLQVLGDGLNPRPFVWDDAYSLCAIAQTIDNDCSVKFPKPFSHLQSKIGHLTYDARRSVFASRWDNRRFPR